jgi:hypothetical protein
MKNTFAVCTGIILVALMLAAVQASEHQRCKHNEDRFEQYDNGRHEMDERDHRSYFPCSACR